MNKELTMEKTSLPVGWEMKTLGDISDFQRGLTYSRKDAVDFSENIVLRATNIDLDKSCLDFLELKYLNNDFQVKQNKKIVKGGLLICLSSGSKKHLGKVALVTDDYNYAFGGFIGQIIPDNQVVSKYLFYNLVSEAYKKYISELTDGIGINNLKSIDLKSFEIPLPPLPHQKQIVATLDKAFAAIDTAKANAKQNLQNAKELFESYLQNVFSTKGDDWEEKPLKEVCELKSGTTISKSLERNEGDVLYTKVGDMNLPNNEVEINTSTRFVNSNEIKVKQIIPEGAIIFPKRGGAIATNKKRKIIKPTIVDLNTMAIIPENDIDKDYFFHWFQLFDLLSISNGANIPQINNYSFDSVYLPYPISIEEQQKIVGTLDLITEQTKKLEAIYTQKIIDLEEMKKSVLQKAFSGQLNTIN